MQVPSEIVTAGLSVLAALGGAALGTLGTIAQVRARRWEASGQVERSDAQQLWQTQTELVRQLMTLTQSQGERLDRVIAQLVDVTAQTRRTADQQAELVEMVGELLDVTRRTEAQLAQINGGGH